MQIAVVMARPVSQPSEVVASKRRYRWRLIESGALGRYAMELWGSVLKGQNDRLIRNPKA